MAISTRNRNHDPESRERTLGPLRRAAIGASAAITLIAPISPLLISNAAAAPGHASHAPVTTTTTSTTTTTAPNTALQASGQGGQGITSDPSGQSINLPQALSQLSHAEQVAENLQSQLSKAQSDVSTLKSDLTSVRSEIGNTGNNLADTVWEVGLMAVGGIAVIGGAVVLYASRKFKKVNAMLATMTPSEGKEVEDKAA